MFEAKSFRLYTASDLSLAVFSNLQSVNATPFAKFINYKHPTADEKSHIVVKFNEQTTVIHRTHILESLIQFIDSESDVSHETITALFTDDSFMVTQFTSNQGCTVKCLLNETDANLNLFSATTEPMRNKRIN